MSLAGGRSSVVGRERELTIVDDFLDPAIERCRVLVMEGVPGIGKTTVWREAIRRAREQGFRVLSCRPSELEAAFAAAAVADLLEEIPDGALGSLPAPQQRAIQVALMHAEPEKQQLEARAVPAAFRSLLEVLGRESNLVVAVDDEQWLDTSSATTIGFALRRLTDTPIRWLITHRRGSSYALDIERLTESEQRTNVTIGPLTLAAIHGVIKTRLQQPLTRPLLVRLHATCDGNPLYALQLAREIESLGSEAPIDTVPVPDGLRRLIATQIRRLPPATRSELLACAALSSPSVDVVDGVALAPAVEQEIVNIDDHGRITFGHPLYAAAVYGSTPPAHRRELHGRLALMVGDGEERARHLVLAADTPSEPVARAAEEGAALSRTRGSWEAAAELLEHAARLTPPDRQGHAERRIIAAAQHHVHAGDRGRARALLEAILATPLDRALRANALRLLAEVGYNDDNFREAGRQYRNALDLADDPRLVVEILLGLSYVVAQMWDQLWDFPGAAVHAHRALALAEEISDTPLVAEALGYSAMSDFLCGRGIDWLKLERSVALEDPARVVPVERRPSTMAALLALYDGRHAEARNGLNGVRAAAGLRGDESDLAFILTWESWLETRAGSFDAASVLADEAASLATLTGSSSMHAWALTQHAYVRAHLGDVVDTRRLCAEATSTLDSSGYLQPGTWIAASLTLLELSLGNTAAAWQACRPLVEALEALETLETSELWEPVIAFFLPDALEVLIALGELERAAALVQTFERRGHDLDRTWAVATGARCRGLLLAARGDLKRAATALQDADTHHGNLDMPFEHARTLLAKGRIERRARRRSHAHTSLEHALTLFEHTGATLWSKQVRAELEHTHPRRTNGDELTVAERRIAEHAVRGQTNREIAAQLFMSPKTVEAHITHIYRKLHIHTRAELGARLAAEG